MPVTIGQILSNRYRILGVLVQDAISVTYQAQDLSLNRVCAVKELRLDPYAAPPVLAHLRQQFQREAQVLANHADPNLPRVWDYFAWGGSEYMVMDFVAGYGPAAPLTAPTMGMEARTPVSQPPPATRDASAARAWRALAPLIAVAAGVVVLCLIGGLCGLVALATTGVNQSELNGLYTEAMAAYDRGDWEGAIAGFQRIRQRDPNYDEVSQHLYDAHVRYGQAFLAAGRLAEAEAQFRAALQLQPEGTEARQGLAQVESRRTPPATPPPPPAETAGLRGPTATAPVTPATSTPYPTVTPVRSPTPVPTVAPAASYCYVGRKVKYGDDPAPYGTIRGYVRDRYGHGKQGVRVRVQSDGWTKDVYTGYDGFYSICCLEPHLYDVQLVGVSQRTVQRLEVPRYRWTQVDFVEQECP